MRTYIETIENNKNGTTGLAHVTAVINTVTDREFDRVTGRYLIQFAPTFDPATGELDGAQVTEDGEMIAFITNLDNLIEPGELAVDPDLFEKALPAVARAWAQKRREENDAWFAAQTEALKAN